MHPPSNAATIGLTIRLARNSNIVSFRSCAIYENKGVIPAVRKHIEPQQALAGAAVGVCVEEAAAGGVIISALQILEARLSEYGLTLRAI